MIYQLDTSHETLEKNTCHSLTYYNLWKGTFKTKWYQEPLASFIKAVHFKCFDANTIMLDKNGEYGLKGNIWVMAQHKEMDSS